MKFIIGKAQRVLRSNCFILEVKWMHGDADAYTTDTHEYGRRTERLEEHVAFLDTISQFFKHGMGGCDTYVARAMSEDIELSEFLLDTIPNNMFCCEGDAHLEHYKVYWYDENGVRHPVEVVR